MCDTFLKNCLYTITEKYIPCAVKMQKEKQDFLEKRALKIKQGKSKKNVYPEPIKIELDLPFE